MLNFEKHMSEINTLYHQHDKNLCFDEHIHKSYEFVYCKKGQLDIYICGNVYKLQQFQSMLILPGQVHKYHTNEYSESYLCIFAPSFVPVFDRDISGFLLKEPIFDQITFDTISEFFDSNSILLQKSFLYKICHFASLKGVVEKNKNQVELIAKIIDYINKNFLTNISLNQLSHDIGYPANIITKCVNQNLKLNITSLVNQKRIEYSIELLKDTDKDITSIAGECGFGSIRSFNRAFLKEVGKTPKSFRCEKI